MKRDDLIDAFGGISDEFLAEAEEFAAEKENENNVIAVEKKYSRNVIIPWLATAACVCFVFGGMIGLLAGKSEGGKKPNLGNQIGTILGTDSPSEETQAPEEESTQNNAGLLERIKNASENNEKGWSLKDGKWSYIGEDGKLKKGFTNGLPGYEGKTFYFDRDGNAVTGWLTENGSTYYFDDEGIMQTGWQIIDGNTYCFGDDGVLYTDCTTPDGYKVDEKGILVK